ncbi:HAD family hydrolase [Pseudomonas sp. DE0157]|uniref:HAD family hydrolase n=1 Tax=Pseudomonas sp. DE0157 TaxID=2584952 RepID=UPI0011A79F6E|nr:HAD hydrolase-like protein [Pseudomonas sp. DE0157]
MKTYKLATSQYKTLIFDCDGVLLNSNEVKTEAFFKTALPYGKKAALTLAEHHKNNGGISRYKKFNYFLEHIVTEHIHGLTLEHLLHSYSEHVISGLLNCEVASGLSELRQKTPHARWLVVSGGDQSELREIFARRELDGLFDGGIFGSPDSKEIILSREQSRGNIAPPALFIGDSKYDYMVANEANIDFVFVSDWTEVNDWRNWCATKKIIALNNLSELIS